MEKDGLAKSSDTSIEKEGFISQSLFKDGISNQSLPDDHIGIENISVEPVSYTHLTLPTNDRV